LRLPETPKVHGIKHISSGIERTPFQQGISGVFLSCFHLIASGPEFEFLDKDIHSSHKTTSLNLFFLSFLVVFGFFFPAYSPLSNTASVRFGFGICLYTYLDLLCFVRSDLSPGLHLSRRVGTASSVSGWFLLRHPP